jgi:hypothetical protein
VWGSIWPAKKEIVMATPPSSLAVLLLRGDHFGRGGADSVLLLIGLVFAGVLVWAIQRSGKRTT